MSMLVRRRPSAASVVAVLVTLAVGSQVGLAGGSNHNDAVAPQAVPLLEVVAADSSSVTIAWPPTRDNDAVVGYGVYLNGAQVDTEIPEHVRKWRDKGRDKESLLYTIRELACGTGYTVGVDAFDRADNHSPVTQVTVSTSVCTETTEPSAPDTDTAEPSAPDSDTETAEPSAPDTDTTASSAPGTETPEPAPDTDTPDTDTTAPSAPVTDTTAPSASATETTESSARPQDRRADTRRGSSRKDQVALEAVALVEVTAADGSSVTIEWPSSRDNDRVVGYGIYLNGAEVGTQTAKRGNKRRNQESLSYTIRGLACGTGYTVGVDAYDRAGNRSQSTSTTVSTSACDDDTAPSAPTGIRQVATTESAVTLAWSPSSDNVGVVEYGLYVAGLRVTTVSEPSATLDNLACGTSYLVGIDAADAAGNRSPRIDSYFQTSACPRTNQPPTTPTNLKITAATQTSLTLAWTASSDDDAVAGYGLYLAGKPTTETTNTNANFTGLQCGTTYTVGVDAYDTTGKRSTIAQLTAATTPCTPTHPPPPTAATVTQTIADESTLSGAVDWRAVYDGNGDGVQDDPGSIRFLVDGKLVLTEQSIPFGDSSGFWASTSVANGPHTFEVRATSDSGTVVGSSTVSASVANDAAPPAGDTAAPSSPGSLRVVSVGATSVTLAWSASSDDVGVAGYGLYRGSSRSGETQQTTASFSGLTCGTGYQLGVDAYDAAGNRSSRADLTVTTAACPDTQPPSAPSNLTVSNRTTTSIALTWAPATDNVGVTAYGIYNAGELVNTATGTSSIVSGLQCGTTYTLSVDAFDGSGNSSPKTNIMASTLPCPDTTAPTVAITSPANGSTVTSTINVSANASDNVGVTRVEFDRDGVPLGSDTSAPYSLALDTTTITNGNHTFGARSYDSAGNVGNATDVTVTVSNATPPSSGSTGAVTQTLANGATVKDLVGWRAVYDKNGDGTEDDPGTIEFLIDGKRVLTESDIPFGDTFATGSPSTSNGSHTFQVRALSDSGTLLATNTVTATVSTTTPITPPPPPEPTTGFPDSSTTGVPPGTALKPMKHWDVTVPNQVIDSIEVTDFCMRIQVPGVVIRNSKIPCVIVENGALSGTPLTIQDSEIDCSTTSWRKGVNGGNFRVLRTDIHSCEDGVYIYSNVTVQDSYIHDLQTCSGCHNDGIQAEKSNIVIERNTIYGVNTSAININNLGNEGTSQNVLIKDNLLAGGNYTLYCPENATIDFRIIENAFSTIFWPNVGRYGPTTDCGGEFVSGNVYHETGLVLTVR